MDNHLYVLSELRYQLECVRIFGDFNESNDVVRIILELLPDQIDDYLRAQRKAFLDNLVSASGDANQDHTVAVIDNLSVFWTDAVYWHDNEDNIDLDGRVTKIIEVYYPEVINYVALVYYLYLICQKKIYFPFWEKFPGLERRDVYEVLIDACLLDEERIVELEASTEALNHPLKTPGSEISKNTLQDKDPGLKWDSIANLESFIKITIENLRSKQELHETDWEFVDGKNKEDFKELVNNLLDRDSSESYYRHSLFIVDKVARLYHDIRCQDLWCSSSEPEATICNQCGDLLVSYLGIILMRNQALPPAFCLYRMIHDLDIDVRAHWRYLMDRMAEFNSQSTNLNNKYQAIQCANCKLRGCYGRYSDRFGTAKYIGGGYDDRIFKLGYSNKESKPRADVKDIIVTTQPRGSAQKVSSYKPITDNSDFLKYLNALKSEGYLDDSYKWIKSSDHTNYHAGWAAKIITSNVEGIRYKHISDIIGIRYLADYASKCNLNEKSNKKQSIEACFSRNGLSTTTL